MSRNLKNLLCCVLALAFVACTFVCVFADSQGLLFSEESVTAEDVTVVEDATNEAEEVVSTPAADETTTVAAEEDSAPVADETTTVADETTTVAAEDDSTPAEEATDAEDVSTPAEDESETPVTPVKLGDVNGDDQITAADARLALRISAKIDVPSEIEAFCADVTGDAKVEAKDARRILRVSAKLDSEADFGKDI